MRQPFVGLVLAAVIGIVAADYFPAINGPLLFIAILGAVTGLRWSYAPLVFALVGATFFALHSARIANTPGDELVQIAGAETRPANVIGIVTTEPKIEVTGNASFLLRLHKARINGQDFQTNATVLFAGEAGRMSVTNWRFLELSNQSSHREIPVNSTCVPTLRDAM